MSFQVLIIGKNIGDIFDSNIELDFKHKEYVYLGKENYWDDGIDLINLTKSLFDWLNKYKWQIKDLGEGTIIEVIKIEKYCKKTDIPNDLNNAVVWSLDVNDHCSNSIEDLEKKYN